MVRDMLLAALALTAPADSEVRLDELLTFADPARCVPGKAFGTIIDQLRVFRSADLAPFHLNVPEQYQAAFPGGLIKEGNGAGRVKILQPVNGIWHGVGVLSIGLEWAPDAEEPDLSLFFAAPPPVVLEILSSQGLIGPSGVGRVEPKQGGTLITCQRDD